jgi:hypothetical protein
MKNTYLTLLFLFSAVGFSQYNPTAPWKNSTSNSKNTNFQNEVDAFNEYWKTHNKNIKGSGYKPFKRWESFYENQLNPDGTIVTPQQLWAAWEVKNNAKANRSNSAMALPPSNWQPVGPFSHTNTGSWSSGQGRTSAVAIDPLDTNTIYVGSPAGGIWKSTDSGTTWTPLSDDLPQIGISGIAIDHPSVGNLTVYIATGDKDGSDTYSIGVLKSVNGGPWISAGLTFTGTGNQAGDLILHPTNNQILLCATSAGLYRTIDGGTTWNVEQDGDFSQGSIRFKPNDPTVVYATGYNTSGTTGFKFYKSTNTGDTFSNVTSGLSSAATNGRLILDVTPADNNYVYVLSVNTGYALNGIYRSTNSGTNFTKTSGTTDILESTQGGYDLALAVSNTNKDLVFTGCLNVWKSSNGGAAVTKVNNWSSPTSAPYTHADIHHLQYINGKLYCLSDGGIYVSTNNGTNFTDLTAGLQISQFYRVSVSKTSAGKMVGGLQDNGGYAYSSSSWKNYYGADGMDAAVSQVNSNLFYGFIQNGSSMYISNDGGNTNTGGVGSPGGIDGNWITPLRGDSQGNMYSGFDGLYKLTCNSWVQQNTNSIGSGNLEIISIDPSNDNIIYVANGSSLYKSTNAGITFASVYSGATITSVAVHSSNSNIVYITTSGNFGQAMISTTGGTSFTDIASGLPSIGKNCIIHQGRNTNNPLYVGTSLGVYYKDDSMTTWQPFDTNLPNVSVRDLEINLEDSKIIAATYGRGIWQSDIPVQVPSIDLKFETVNNISGNINCGASVIPQIVVKNSGTNAISNVTVNYTVDSTPFTYNWVGNIAVSQIQTIDLPSVTTASGSHNLEFNVTTTGDAFSDNNKGKTTFYTNNSGIVGSVNSFTNVSDELIVLGGGCSGNWTRGNRTSDALATAGNTAYLTNLSGNYPDGIKTYLVSQCYNLNNVSNPQISFKLAYSLELNWDIVYVQYSTDFGANWNLLGTSGSGWYNSNRTPQTSGSDCNNCPGGQWTGANTTLTTYTYPLSALNTQSNVIFRIVFHSDEGTVDLGAKVDDFVINGVLSTDSFEMNQIEIYPNPSNGIFNLNLKNIEANTIEIYDVSGKLIEKMDVKSISQLTQIDLSNASNGIYFVKISTENNTITKRIIKN